MPKTGSTSIRVALGSEDKRVDVPQFPVFTTFRNPVARCHSAYQELKRMNKWRGRWTGNRSDFDTYLTECENNGFWNEHQMPQVDYLNQFWARFPEIYERIFRLTDIEGIERFIGCKLPKENVSTEKECITKYASRIWELYPEDYYFWYNEL